MIRPEAMAQIMRWREIIVAIMLASLGTYWALRGAPIMQYIGGIVIGLAVLLAIVGFQRARFRQKGGGIGFIQVSEARITYFGPLTGGTIALPELIKISYDHKSLPAHWVLHDEIGQSLFIPANAQGTESLFDAFASLDGFQTEAMLRTINTSSHDVSVIWRRNQTTRH